MRCLCQNQPDRASAKVDRHVTLENNICRNNDYFSAAFIFFLYAVVHIKELVRTVRLYLFHVFQKIAVCLFVGYCNAVYCMHCKCMVPMPVCKDRNRRKRQTFLLKKVVKLFKVSFRVACIDRQAYLFSLNITEIRTVTFLLERHIPYVF